MVPMGSGRRWMSTPLTETRILQRWHHCHFRKSCHVSKYPKCHLHVIIGDPVDASEIPNNHRLDVKKQPRK